MIIWGGCNTNACSSYFNSGGLYDPSSGASGAWTAMTTTNAPTARSRNVAIWTGSKFIVWVAGMVTF